MKGYRIIKALGAGGYGDVLLAQREGSGTLSVIKKLREEVTQDEVARGRFLREAQIGTLLLHPNLARLEDAWFEDGSLCIASELIAGRDLEAILLRSAGQIPRPIAVAIMIETLAGLHHAHELRGTDGEHLGLVHRDFSPKNVMVGFGGEVKLIDFGIARASVGDFRTTPGTIVGTLRYLSPEQAAGKPVDRKSDIYSAGAILFELITGRPLVAETELKAIIFSIIMRSAPPVLPALDPVLARALAKDAGDRHPTARHLADALRKVMPEIASREQIAAFVSSLYPEEKAELEQMVNAARSTEPAIDPTRVATTEQFIPPRPRILAWPIGLLVAACLLATAIALGVARPPLGTPALPPPPAIQARPLAPTVTPRAPPIVEAAVEPAKKARAKAPAPAKPIDLAAPKPVRPDRLRAWLHGLADGSRDGRSIFELEEQIKAEAQRITDAQVRTRIMAKAHSSAAVGDLAGLGAAIDELDRAR